MVKSSDTRARILQFIRNFAGQKGYAPTVRDIVKGCHISTTSVVQHHLGKLEKECYIQRDPQVFRSIRLVGTEAEGTVDVPLLGTIAAGDPIPVPDADSWVAVSQETIRLTVGLIQGREDVFALRVKGTSMIDALIDDGDIVLMQRVGAVNDGDMAAVWLKDRQEVTLKRIYRGQGEVRLQPANRMMSPIFARPENVEVQGRVVAVLRRLSNK